ncbi:molybdenum cofactor guanylyltransferase MobA [Niveispirillum sp. SYP-B3756]|uniref:molybdenum cofactor guanylyltransferase MobA n=1 Tax=Niveispirillum sp. SYP-B3756 TaxID=2662178 RepID=UPI0012923416|nr:molybdenum cofactor guanylyltransferase MobA [Niveispirillum sp. SYP-B3756]MQP63902.1 molybdenum cofactor guanylyltransferase MobA [Niveispirillum sp. SYP-B3756]
MAADTGIIGAILAGGQGRRMGGDKPLTGLAGRPLLAHVARRLAPQVGRLVLNANGDPARFAGIAELWGVTVVPDTAPDQPGPLAGLLAVLEWAERMQPAARHVLSVPADCPFLPHDLASRLALAAGDGVALARTAAADGSAHSHPVVGLWPVALRDDLRAALLVEGLRRVGQWAGRHQPSFVDWPDMPLDPFLNLNTPDDLATAERLLAAYPDA